MRSLNLEALAFCLTWITIVMAGWILAGWLTGLALTIGLFVLIMGSSTIIFATSGDLLLERRLRWGILTASALLLLSFADLRG